MFLASLVTALATGLGALAFVAIHDMSRLLLGISNAVAAGLMLGASIMLIREGAEVGALRAVLVRTHGARDRLAAPGFPAVTVSVVTVVAGR